jgi:hypothetical protein
VPPAFEAVAHVSEKGVEIGWVSPPKDPEATLEEFGQDAAGRARLLHDWLARLSFLVRDIEGWAKELGWATRVIDKPMEDSLIGQYRAPGLLMQEGTDRVLLEPVGRSAPGTEGVVDLYRMPAYDDVATLYFYDGHWNLHSVPSGTEAVATVRETKSKPLSREALQEVLTELRQHAA